MKSVNNLMHFLLYDLKLLNRRAEEYSSSVGTVSTNVKISTF